MKQLFIFLSIVLFGLGCTHHKSVNHENTHLVLSAEAREWRSSAPGSDDLTEHAVDLIIELQDQLNDVQFSHVIYDERKSFPVTVQASENGTVLVKARIVYKSDLLAETSPRADISDRLVFQDTDGNTGFIPIDSWSEKPLEYR